VITDKAILGFDPVSKKMSIVSIHPGNTLDDVVANMGFKPLVPTQVPLTEPPSAEQLRLIREVIDPQKVYVG